MSTESASPSDAADDTLAAALARHQVQLEPEQVALLDRYARQLWDWNTRLNLTRHTDYEKLVARDVLDTLALADLLETGERVLDVGTGGGVPGVVLAIVRPDVSVSLCDSVGKKARAVESIVQALDLEVPVYAARVQEVLAEHEFDTLLARAVGPLARLLAWLAPHWGSFERLLLIKGPRWVDERREARQRGLLRGLDLRKRASYAVAGSGGEGVILEVRRAAN